MYRLLRRYARRYLRAVVQWDAATLLTLAVAGLSISLAGYLLLSTLERAGTYLYEDVAFALAPSGGRAFAYGERHFDGENAQQYDIKRAQMFFLKAVVLDPTLPYVHHELARIAFLDGDLGTALAQIDVQIALHGDSVPIAYYVRGLIEGYQGNYDAAAKDYQHFLIFRPHSWAALNDYSWVLLKAGQTQEAVAMSSEGLKYFPNNPWLLNTNAIALYERGDIKIAHQQIIRAWEMVQNVQANEWLHNYPGNDPAIAGEGIATFRESVLTNMHKIEFAMASSTVQ